VAGLSSLLLFAVIPTGVEGPRQGFSNAHAKGTTAVSFFGCFLTSLLLFPKNKKRPDFSERFSQFLFSLF
jgi:hypothetical protein